MSVETSVKDAQVVLTSGADDKLLSQSDINIKSMRREGTFMYFDSTANELASLTLTQMSRLSRKFNIKINIDVNQLRGYYGRILLQRVKSVIESIPQNVLDDEAKKILVEKRKPIPQGCSPKYVRMFDVAHTIINLIGYVEVQTPRLFIVPLLKDVDAVFNLCDDDTFKSVEAEIAYFGSEFSNFFPVRKGISKDPEGEEAFMKVCIVDQVVASIEQDVNPVIIAYASLSTHEVSKGSELFYGWHCGALEDYQDIVKANIAGRT